jgi:acetyl esterase/lipase
MRSPDAVSLSLALVLLAAASAPGQPPGPPPAPAPLPAGTKVLKDLAYVEGGHERQRLDLYLPPSGKGWPLVVSIHGGAFRMGSKDGSPPARRARSSRAASRWPRSTTA